MTDTELDLDRIEQAARDSLRFGGDRQVAQYCLDLVAEVRRLEVKQRVPDNKTVLECPTCDYTVEIDPDDLLLFPDQEMFQCRTCLSGLMRRED